MTDVPAEVMAKFKRLARMRDMAQAAAAGASQNAHEAQSAWNENWNAATRQLLQYGQPYFSEEGELYCEQRRMEGAKRVDFTEPHIKQLAAQLVRSRDDLREARRLVAEAGKRAAPVMRLAHDCERLLAERYGWSPNPFATNLRTSYGAVS
jgi:hypothetical protein